MASSTNTPTKWSKNVGTPWKQREHLTVNIATFEGPTPSEAKDAKEAEKIAKRQDAQDAKQAKWKVNPDQIKEEEESILFRSTLLKKTIYQPKLAQPVEEMNVSGETPECINFRKEKQRQSKTADLLRIAREKDVKEEPDIGTNRLEWAKTINFMANTSNDLFFSNKKREAKSRCPAEAIEQLIVLMQTATHEGETVDMYWELVIGGPFVNLYEDSINEQETRRGMLLKIFDSQRCVPIKTWQKMTHIRSKMIPLSNSARITKKSRTKK